MLDGNGGASSVVPDAPATAPYSCFLDSTAESNSNTYYV
jgi:hypothetical protein